MVQSYPTSLRVLVLAENDIAPELQQQISDLLSEGEEEEDPGAPPTHPSPAYSSDMLPPREKQHHPHHQQHAGPWIPYSSKG